MGDMADYYLGVACNQLVHYERYKDAPLAVQYEEGLIDEHGISLGDPTIGGHSTAVKGKGRCPICSSSTTKKTGKYGVFYGCVNYPSCKGSRGLY